jgi:hypothetical protein
MFKPSFKSSNNNFNSEFDGYEVLKGEDGFSPIVETIPTADGN